MDRDPTCIGKIRHILGATITVALNDDMAGIAPIYRGRVLSVGQIGSLVRIPQGLVDLIASVSLVGISELSGKQQPADIVQHGERWLQIQLLGEIDRATKKFQRGVGSYPSLDDTVHFATPEELSCVFPSADKNNLRIGSLSSAEELAVCLNASRMVMRHTAVVGSTGSGKTSAVASILQSVSRGGWNSANIVVVDPHGEYARALGENASVRSVLGQGDKKLRVPYWSLTALDILKIFCGSTGGGTFVSRFSELVTEARRVFAKQAKWLNIDQNAITSDTPIPFDIRPIWYQLDRENRETRSNKADATTSLVTDEGSCSELKSATFEPYNQGGAAPFKGPMHGVHNTMPELLRLGIIDPRLSFFLEPMGELEGDDPLLEVVRDWLGREKPISVLDFSGVPAEAADMAIGVVLNLLFELTIRSEPDGPGIGRPSPVFIVLEEAHRYLGASASAMTRDSANRIAREGRKYGIGLMLVTQRPTELPETALAQCGTLIALRLTNASDQGAIKSALPDNVAGLAAVLPSLRTGEAIISGEAVVLPFRALLDRPDPLPKAEDPSLDPWREEASLPDLSKPLSTWRGTYNE